ncbi:FAD:protein FMN transferase [Pelagirhabdus alkalitolerans]|nr:FAD:protein FMN transferase [Pelagirhabdus alkalitolerans]
MVAIVSVFILIGCSNTEDGLLENPYQETDFYIGTVINLSVYDEDKEYVIEESMELIDELEHMLSEEIDTSVVSEINRQAGIEPVEVPDELYELMEVSLKFGEDSDGGFDVTVGPLTDLWRIGYDDARVPSQAEIDEVLKRIDHESVVLNEENQTVFLEQEGMELDLGAIAKGYITDKVNELMEEEGVRSAILDLGGNIFVRGHRPSGDKFTIGVQNPYEPRGEIAGRIRSTDESVVTSGIYERYIEEDGVKYHHLLNPDTGYPFDNEIAGVTIISENSTDGDALSTVVFAKGLEDGIDYIESLDDAEAIFVSRDKEIILSSGVEDEFELINDDFEVIDY